MICAVFNFQHLYVMIMKECVETFNGAKIVIGVDLLELPGLTCAFQSETMAWIRFITLTSLFLQNRVDS